MMPAAAAVVAVSGMSGINMIVDSRASLTVDDGVPSDGDALMAWINLVPGKADLQQGDPALRPLLRSGVAAGILTVEFSGQKHLACVTADADLFDILVVNVPDALSGERVFLSRDTPQSGTTKPAYSVGLNVA